MKTNTTEFKKGRFVRAKSKIKYSPDHSSLEKYPTWENYDIKKGTILRISSIEISERTLITYLHFKERPTWRYQSYHFELYKKPREPKPIMPVHRSRLSLID